MHDRANAVAAFCFWLCFAWISLLAISLTECSPPLGSGMEAPDTGSSLFPDSGDLGPSTEGAAPENGSLDALMCPNPDCPYPWATCPGVRGLCTTNLRNDPLHCGSCDTPCPNLTVVEEKLHASSVCGESTCHVSCTYGWGDCNGLVDDGCEDEVLTDAANCGLCGIQCASGVRCIDGFCGCPPPREDCDGYCADLSADPNNCGGCGNVCTPPAADAGPSLWPCGPEVYPPQTTWNCSNGACGLRCAAGHSDCDRDLCGDGCEKDTTGDPKNCGSCGHECAPDDICSQGACVLFPVCPSEFFTCPMGECVDLQNDPRNCGACGNLCPGPAVAFGKADAKGSPVCIHGRCGYECFLGYADCDYKIENGCETNIQSNNAHCGGCDNACDVDGGQPCVEGVCLTKPCKVGDTH